MSNENDKITVTTDNGVIYLTQGDQKIAIQVRQWDNLRLLIGSAQSWAKSWLKQFDPNNPEIAPKVCHDGDECEGQLSR